MSSWFGLVAAAYALFGLLLWAFEAARMRKGGCDAITVFVVLAGLQTCIAGIGIFGALPFADSSEATGVAAFDRIFFAADLRTAWLVLCLTVWFFVFFYAGAALGCMLPRSMLRRSTPAGSTPEIVLHVRTLRLLIVVALGTAASMGLFLALGTNSIERYSNLILLRSKAGPNPSTNINENAFAFTQTWSWLSVLAALVVRQGRGRGPIWLCCVGAAVFLAILGVSRRALFLPVLLVYLALVLRDNRWRAGWVAACTIPLVLLLAYGKSFLATVARGGDLASVTRVYGSTAGALLRASSELGITIVESLGTIALIDVPPRVGVDHLLSVVRRVPDRMLGLEIEFPERIVRTATTVFDNSDALDIPPGLMGQMWLDAGPVGPVFWGLFLGMQVGLLQAYWQRTRRSLEACGVFALLLFVVALPVNSGSFDFSVNIAVATLLAVILWSVKVRVSHLADSERSEAAAGGAL